ncbi:receptor-like protein EIX1 [Cornus florida]|uniref:receptor-like protein EIX1 n=1 Tax=Cornus florida TaxID=4283 RepID=UPI00289CDD13|nr:receptor-like protein EIX1 [Cornus florida]
MKKPSQAELRTSTKKGSDDCARKIPSRSNRPWLVRDARAWLALVLNESLFLLYQTTVYLHQSRCPSELVQYFSSFLITYMIMNNFIAIAVLLLFWFLVAATSIFSSTDGQPAAGVVCSEKEKRALLSFKQGLTTANRLSSWSVHQDCCQWAGVHCDNVTGRVIELRLSAHDSYRLGGKITTPLLKLEFLRYLDLSWNDFHGTSIPSFLGSMRSLRSLNLSNAGFVGAIPHQLGNLSSLRYLNLGLNTLYVDNLSWIARFYSLEYLDMSSVDLHKVTDWLEVVSMLPSLSQLHLSNCLLDKMITPLGFVNFTSLQVLDFSFNLFDSKIPNWLFNLSTSLLSLGLSYNSLHGHIPDEIGQLKHLEYLRLSGNSFSGPILVAI